MPKQTNIYGIILRTLRFTGMLLLNIFWHLFIKHVYSPSVVFVCYGSAKINRSFLPVWAENLAKKLDWQLLVLCFLNDSRQRIGLAVGTWNLEHIVKLQDKVLKAFPRAKAIALAGRLPSLLHQAGGKIKAPVVGGVLGTRYAMQSVALDLAKRAGMTSARESTIAVIGGAGYVGSQVVKDLALEFEKVVAVDPRLDDIEATNNTNSNILSTNDPCALQGIKLFLLLAPCGDDLAPWVPYIEPGSYIADDTHPCVGSTLQAVLKSKKIHLLKAATQNIKEPLTTSPRLPNFQSNSVPGCLLEALVVARSNGGNVTKNFKEFCESAKSLGFESQLMEDLEEVLVGFDDDTGAVSLEYSQKAISPI